ncbi:MAG: acetyl-CoA sensor PanZ family protein [Oleispira sp.]|nr:acetyl-CoA sensor PanZ family protein [Oleispira sp.]MBL4880727.1 acetyl-CoA sensor PanZ family protein [Oleispira sp.]
MPVHLEHISQPSEQDWIDLGKIYADAPPQWLSDNNDIKASLQALLDQDVWFISGRFNARLLGAMQARKNGNNITLSHFCVRNITVKRGVAHQMLHHINAWADANGYTLIAKGVPEELAKPLIKRDFIVNNNDFIRNPK